MSMDMVFRALADATRRKLLDRLYRKNAQTLGELCEGLNMTRSAVAKHLSVLKRANLVSWKRQGRERLHFINPLPINDIAQRWISKFEHQHLSVLSKLKKIWKENSMSKLEQSTFVYVTFIRTTPERLWSALTSADFMKEYWFGVHISTDWKVGAPWKMIHADGKVTDTGEIGELDPPRRLVLNKWRNEWKPELGAEGYSRCVIELEPVAEAVKLTVTHTIDHPESKLIQAVSGGWPRILSNLKSLLETGQIGFALTASRNKLPGHQTFPSGNRI